MSPLSRLQRLAVETRDRDLLIAAGAGSGKTRVLVERVLGCLADGIPLERILVVTFTEKAAMEMKNRIYRTLSESPQLAHLRLQLPQARISTIHAFCARLLREQFERAGVDPRFRILSEEDATLLLEEAVTRVFEDGYRGSWGEEATETFARLVEMCGYDEEGERLRKVVRRLLEYARASDDPARFLDQHLERMGRHGAWDDLPWREDYARRAALAWRTATGLLRMLAGRATANDPKNRPFAELARALEAIDPERLGDPAGQHEALAALERAGVIARDAEGASFSIDLPTLRRSPELGKLRQVVKEALGNVYLAAMPLDTVELLAEEGQSAHYARALVHLTQRVHAAYEEAKGRTGRLDYSDLEIRTLALLEGSPAGEAEEKPVGFDRVFVDEFQDVNGLQHRILSRLCDPAGVFRVGDVKQSIYQFRLADPSIFRALGQSRAWVEDPEHPPREEPAWTVPLPENFRSLVPVLQAVNRISERIFLDEEIGGSYERERLEPGGKAEASPPPGAPVELLLVRPPANGDDAEAEAKGEAKAKAETEVEGEADAEAGAKAEMEAEAKPSCGGEDDAANAVERLGDGATGFVDPIEAEARAIARRLREILDSGETVRDPESGAPRRAAFGDIAILVRVRADAPPIGRILEEHGIPVHVSAGAPFFESREVRDAIGLLRVTDNLLDDIALAAALRSPAFGWSDAELLALRIARPYALHLAYGLASIAGAIGTAREMALLPRDPEARSVLLGSPGDLPDHPLLAGLRERAAAAVEAIVGWREAAGHLELPALLERILDETRLLDAVAALPGGLQRQANLRKLVTLARRFAGDSGHALPRFLRWLDDLEMRGVPIAQAPLASASIPAVRILTVHEAKGLEFPIVVVARTDRLARVVDEVSSLAPGPRYIGVRLLDPARYLLRDPWPLRLLRDEGKRATIAEEKRILYVAMTRARDRLLLSGCPHTRAVAEPLFRELFEEARREADPQRRAALVEMLLARKPSWLGWILCALPPLPDRDGEVEGTPFVVRWSDPIVPGLSAPPENAIRALEPALRALEPAALAAAEPAEADDVAAGSAGAESTTGAERTAVAERATGAGSDSAEEADREADAAYERVTRRPPFPWTASLSSARAKLWATEFKSASVLAAALSTAEDEEPAALLLAPSLGAAEPVALAGAPEAKAGVSAAAAAEQGIRLHEMLERIDFAGIDEASLAPRVEAAAPADGGATPEEVSVLSAGLRALLASPTGRALSTARAIEREVAFSLRLPLSEAARLLPDLAGEIANDPGWAGALGDPDRMREAGDPWILVQGRIDLVFRDPATGVWTVLDWKSDRVAGDEAIEERTRLYAGQMAIYRRAASELFGSPARAVLFFLRPGILREVDSTEAAR